MKSHKLVIIIPAYNEEKNIFRVIKNIPSLPNLNQEILVINDGSTDATADVAKKTGAIVISNIKNLGLGKTFRIGLKEALKRNADLIVNLDADGQYDPKQIPSLIAPVLNNTHDFVIGNRFTGVPKYDRSLIKKWGNKFVSIFISKILLRLEEIFDIQSGFRAFHRDLAEFLIKTLNGKYTYTQEMLITSSLHNFRIKQIPISFYKRTSGKSRLIKNPFIYLYKILGISMKTYISFILKKEKNKDKIKLL